MKYRIAQITEAYIDGYCSAVDSVARERKYLVFLEGPPLAMSREFVLRNLKRNFPHFIALHENTVIGWCDIVSSDHLVYAHSGVLGMGVVAPYRGHGIGNSLIQAALNEAKLNGLTRIELTVRENNKAAIALYEKMGFQVEGVHRNALKIGSDYEDHIFMGLLW